jgi:pyridoxal/pyridoxine/pyridoxamine kinase
MIPFPIKKINVNLRMKGGNLMIKNRLPEWAVEVRSIMLEYRITNRQIALEVGKSEQHVSNILTGYRENLHLQKAICDYVYQMKKSQKAS